MTTTVYESLKDLDEDYEKCDRCSICKSRKTSGPVFGVGNPNARIMVIGDAPGEEDESYGGPFSPQSPAGQILNMQMKSCTLKRKDVYITNLVMCRPTIDGDKSRTATKEEVAECIQRLYQEILLVDPWVILLMGDTTMRYLLKTNSKADSLIGKIHNLYIPTPDGSTASYTAFAITHPMRLSREDSGWSPNGPSRRMTDFMRLAVQSVRFLEVLRESPESALSQVEAPNCGEPVTRLEDL